MKTFVLDSRQKPLCSLMLVHQSGVLWKFCGEFKVLSFSWSPSCTIVSCLFFLLVLSGLVRTKAKIYDDDFWWLFTCPLLVLYCLPFQPLIQFFHFVNCGTILSPCKCFYFRLHRTSAPSFINSALFLFVNPKSCFRPESTSYRFTHGTGIPNWLSHL